MSPEYRSYIDTVLKPWVRDHVEQGNLVTEDGVRLHYCHAVPENPKGCIVMIHGFCEFFGKYHETAYRFYEAGYAICFAELRGHGRSERMRYYPDERVYVRSFQDYVLDARALVRYARKQHPSLPLYLFAHSMGGTVGALYLEQNPGVFQAAVLSSPMLQMNYGTVPDEAVGLLAVYSKAVSLDDPYAPGQHVFTGEDEFETSSAMDRDRYEYQMEQRREDPSYQTWGATWSWAKAAREGASEAVKHADEISTPVLVLQAGKDTMVKSQGQETFVKNCPAAELKKFEDSKHEIFNAEEETRKKYYSCILDYYASH
ncbi:alpha/beta hydrolase [Stecheria intestinalis]|uniref:alpha/beta hydrolase n=1 Tax=Stecheria intestinalis TaxID=2606630 RepID=UPI0023F3CE52|nr:alpha/beta hydrolase [Stecheria intestinalis]MDD5882454.1 alpha/beta hydrolase [Stecheria intestinalis]